MCLICSECQDAENDDNNCLPIATVELPVTLSWQAIKQFCLAIEAHNKDVTDRQLEQIMGQLLNETFSYIRFATDE